MKNKNYFILLVLFLSALQIKAQYSFDNVLYGAAYYHEYMPYEQLILVYCRSGRRSKIASEELVKLGYTNVKEFGGIIDWPYEVVK